MQLDRSVVCRKKSINFGLIRKKNSPINYYSNSIENYYSAFNNNPTVNFSISKKSDFTRKVVCGKNNTA